MDKLNLSGLFEAVPVSNNLPLKDGYYPCIWEDGHTEESYCEEGKFRVDIVTHYLRPVTSESVEAFLREFGEKVWESSIKRTGEEEIASMFASNIPMECPDKQTAITELINKILGQ